MSGWLFACHGPFAYICNLPTSVTSCLWSSIVACNTSPSKSLLESFRKLIWPYQFDAILNGTPEILSTLFIQLVKFQTRDTLEYYFYRLQWRIKDIIIHTLIAVSKQLTFLFCLTVQIACPKRRECIKDFVEPWVPHYLVLIIF